METVELIVYLGIAVIIGGLVIGFIAGIDTQQIYSAIQNMFTRDETVRYTRVDHTEIAPTIYNAWRHCGYGQREYELIISLENLTATDPPITKQHLFDYYYKFNLCHSIQSADYHDLTDNRCGTREDMEIINDEIEAPALISIKCNPNADDYKLIINRLD